MKPKQGNTLRIIVWIVSLGLCLSAGRTIIDLVKRQDIVKVRRSELVRLKQDNAVLKQKLNDIENETYVERVARDTLGLVKEGETLILVPANETDQEAEGTDALALPYWRRWLQLFF